MHDGVRVYPYSRASLSSQQPWDKILSLWRNQKLNITIPVLLYTGMGTYRELYIIRYYSISIYHLSENTLIKITIIRLISHGSMHQSTFSDTGLESDLSHPVTLAMLFRSTAICQLQLKSASRCWSWWSWSPKGRWAGHEFSGLLIIVCGKYYYYISQCGNNTILFS